MSEKYLKFPLALFRTASNEVDFFERAASFAIVNAGYGFRENHDECGFSGKFEAVADFDGDEYSEEAIVGASIIGINLLDKSGLRAEKLYDEVVAACPGSPLVTIKSDFFWNACYTARNEAGDHGIQPNKRISWREFRVLCAIYSLKWNGRGFCTAGLEYLSHRACGFHNKAGFRSFNSSDVSWPEHCLPLSGRKIGITVGRLEELGFFLRCRIGSGTRGGLTAYSIRHKGKDGREALMRDCVEWQALNQRATSQDNRRDDRDLYAKMTAEVKGRTARLERKAPKKPKSGHRSGINTHSVKVPVQVVVQAPVQHKEKCSEKCSSDKYKEKSEVTPPAGGGVFFNEESKKRKESGYLAEGKFVVSADAVKIVSENPESWNLFKAATRITAPDGSTRIEEAG